MLVVGRPQVLWQGLAELRADTPSKARGAEGERGVTADTAMRLSRYLGTTPGFWMNLQMRYELDHAEDALGDTLNEIVPLKTVEVA